MRVSLSGNLSACKIRANHTLHMGKCTKYSEFDSNLSSCDSICTVQYFITTEVNVCVCLRVQPTKLGRINEFKCAHCKLISSLCYRWNPHIAVIWRIFCSFSFSLSFIIVITFFSLVFSCIYPSLFSLWFLCLPLSYAMWCPELWNTSVMSPQKSIHIRVRKLFYHIQMTPLIFGGKLSHADAASLKSPLGHDCGILSGSKCVKTASTY